MRLSLHPATSKTAGAPLLEHDYSVNPVEAAANLLRSYFSEDPDSGVDSDLNVEQKKEKMMEMAHRLFTEQTERVKPNPPVELPTVPAVSSSDEERKSDSPEMLEMVE